MVNPYRGEVEATINGESVTLVLTLGALAELEARLNVTNLQALGEKLSTGSVGARDVLEILRAGLRGAGHKLSDDELAQMHVEGGPKAAIKIVAELLTLTFKELS